MTTTSKRKCHRKISGETFLFALMSRFISSSIPYLHARSLWLQMEKAKKIDISPESAVTSHKATPLNIHETSFTCSGES
jgi:hypothetical protein